MRRRRVVVGLVVLALVVVAAVVFWPRIPTEDELRNFRIASADRTVQVGMTAGEVERLLGCPPDEQTDNGTVERWTTRGHFGHTVTVRYVSGRVAAVEGRTWRSKPDPPLWDDLRTRLGL